MKRYLIHLVVIVCFFASVVAVRGVELAWRGGEVWSGFSASGEFRKPKYAEKVYPADLFRTRANTWSNLAYVLVGYYAIALGLFDSRRAVRPENYLESTWPMSVLFGVACCFLGVGSGLFHASLTRWGQQMDVTAMYSPLLVLIAINIGRLWPRWGGLPTWPVSSVTVLLLTVVLYVYKWSLSSGLILPGLILTVAPFVARDMFRPMPRVVLMCVVISVASLVLAVICRETDIAGRFSSPESAFQGHAWWHVLTAVSLGGMYGCYRGVPDVSYD